MKKLLLGLSISLLMLKATPLTLTKEQEKDWQIKTQNIERSHALALGEFMAEVTTPPQQLHAVSLPFEAQIKKLYVAQYEPIKKGQLLADVTGREWIEIQKRFIADAIELKHHGHLAERKRPLCEEGIIPKKECTSANAEHQADKIKVAASKALLRGYGASKKSIHDLFSKLKITKTIQVRSQVTGTLLKLNVRSGKSTTPSEALFVIQKKGALWLEADILFSKAKLLKHGESVELAFGGEKFNAKVLLHAPSINPETQTQKVRFSLPNKGTFLTGQKEMLKISVKKESLKVPKKAVISLGGVDALFIAKEQGFESVAIKVVGEDVNNYFVQPKSELNGASIVVRSVAILKSMLEGGEDE